MPSIHASMNIKKVLMTQLLTFFEIKKDDGRIVSKYKSKLVYIKYGYISFSFLNNVFIL